MNGHNKYVIAVVGPTAVGKTAVGIKLAQQLRTEIISADSRQFYREMEIGTAKPNKTELAAAKHHFINSHSIVEEVNAGSFEKMALKKIKELHNSYDQLILTGGSGLYVSAVLEGMAAMPKTDPSIREKLTHKLETEGLAALTEQLKLVDPQYYKEVDLSNPHRVIRALEVNKQTRKPYSSFRQLSPANRPFSAIRIGLEMEREKLYERIDKRMDSMIAQGLFDEAEKLYPYRKHQALQTVGYKEIFDYMDGAYDKQEAIRLLKRNSRRYAKRQITWFKKGVNTKWFHPSEVYKIVDYICTVT